MTPRRFAAVGGAFAVAGICTVLLGPLLPCFPPELHLSDTQAGFLFAAQFLASVLVAACAGPLAARFGFDRLISCGMLLSAAGTAALLSTPWPLPIFCAALNGAGLGLVIPAGNLAASGSAHTVIYLNLLWGVGAVLAPLIVTRAPLWVVSIACLLCALALAGSTVAAADSTPSRAPFRISRATAFTAMLLFLYVGAETSIAGWIASLAARTAATQSLWTILPSVFWMGILAGRAISPTLLSVIGPPKLILCGMTLSFAAAALMLAQSAPGATTVAVVVCGLGMAPIYPLAVAQYSAVEPAGGASGIIFSAGGLGGAVIPWIIGAISDATGSLRNALATVLVVMLLMSALEIAARRAHP